MKKAVYFSYDDVVISPSDAIFKYSIGFEDDMISSFSESIGIDLTGLPQGLVDGLHLIIGMSYYKMYLPPRMILNTIKLTQQQSVFWATVYKKGLGEFFYVNQLDIPNITFDFDPEYHPKPITLKNTQKALVPQGGGKDSIVTAEILSAHGIDFDIISLRSSSVQMNVAKTLGKKLQVIDRVIDPQMIALSKTGEVYTGHVPISAIYAFVILAFGMKNGYSDIIFSNEYSSNFGSTTYQDLEISHHWSKSIEFETLFSNYVKANIVKNVNYFSFLRPLHEIKIAELFTRYPLYFKVFSGSNHNFKIEKNSQAPLWDLKSIKTFFIFILLSAFLEKSLLVEIFGADMFNDIANRDGLLELAGTKNIKPLDCVGTPQEVLVALSRARDRGNTEGTALSPYINEVLKDVDIVNLEKDVFSYHADDNIPSKYSELLIQSL